MGIGSWGASPVLGFPQLEGSGVSTQEEQLFKTGVGKVNQPRGSGLSCKLDVRIGKKTEYVQLSLFDISRASESSHLSR